MSIKILTKNAIDNTNVDGARANNFNAGRRSGIVKGVLNEGTLNALTSNVIALDTCELRICGHRVIIDQVETRNLTNAPLTTIRYSLIAQIIVDENSNPEFSLFVQLADTPLIQQNLDKTITGAGTYQLEIGRFSYNTNGEIVDVIRTAELITGSGQNGYDYINIGEVTTTMLQSGVDAEVDIENVIDEETGEKKTNFKFSIPETAGTSININGEQKPSIDFKADPQEQLDEKTSYLPQTLTQGQQAQARTNIGAGSQADVENIKNKMSLPIGTIIPSAIPLKDAGVHLLDGSTIAQNGIYADFVTLLKNLVAEGYSLTCSNDEFETDLANTGNCGKFVIDDISGTIRLPRITRFIQGLTDMASLTDIGTSLSASLPNIRGQLDFSTSIGFPASVNNVDESAITRRLSSRDQYMTGSGSAANRTHGIEFNASRNNDIYQDGATVQPQATQFPYYIVLANSYQTDVQVDINNYVNELNAKADKTLLNSLSMCPSNNKISLSITAGQIEQATSNGYIVVEYAISTVGAQGYGRITTSNSSADFWSGKILDYFIRNGSAHGLAISCPVKAGQYYIINHGTATSVNTAQFVLAEEV